MPLLSSIADIMTACQMSTGNFYRYFKSKDSLITYLERQPYEELQDSLVAMRDQHVLLQVKHYILQWTDLAENKWGSNFARAWMVHYISADVKPLVPNKIDVIAIELLLCLQQGIDNGTLSATAPISDLAYMIAFTLFSSSVYSIMTDGNFRRDDWIKQYCSLVENTILKPYCL